MKHLKIVFACLLGFSVLAEPLYRTPVTERSVLVIIYMAARNDLSMYAESHIRQLLELGSSDRVKLFVHLDLQKANETALSSNFFVEKNKLLKVGSKNPKDSGNKETLIEAASLAYEQFPADEVVLILWNHGTGPLEPKITPIINQWELWHVDTDSGKIDLDQSVGYLDRFAPGEGSFKETKGICFDDATGHYLTISELTDALSYISETIIKKKFSILACDACLMAGADVFAGFHHYVDYYVASQEVELGIGYKYDAIVEPLVNDTICCGEELACHFVTAFKQYYSPKIDFYTHVAIDLSYGEELERNIDTLSKLLLYGLNYQENRTIKEAIRLSRHKKYCIRFNEPTYIDLGNFYNNLLTHIASCSLSNDQSEPFKKKLHTVLTEGLDLIHHAVKANEVGSKHEHASGISIYFPEFIIHKSYKKNDFARRTHWLKFLQQYVAL